MVPLPYVHVFPNLWGLQRGPYKRTVRIFFSLTDCPCEGELEELNISKMPTITVPPMFGLAVIETVLYSFVCTWMGVKVGMARKKFGVKLPAAYENKEDSVFNRYQRAHMNAVENAAPFYVSLLLAALYMPLPSVIAGAFYILGRYIYAAGYHKSIEARRRGQPFYSKFSNPCASLLKPFSFAY